MWQANSYLRYACDTWPPIRACNMPATARFYLIGAFGS